MKTIIQERIDAYINAELPLSKVTIEDDTCTCGYCGTVVGFIEDYRPNFCPECGCLLDYTKEEPKSCGTCQLFEYDNTVFVHYMCKRLMRKGKGIVEVPDDFGATCPFWIKGENEE